jgi:hypothetical protein
VEAVLGSPTTQSNILAGRMGLANFALRMIAFQRIMIDKYSILALAVGISALLASGCSKQESPIAPAAENSIRSSAPVVEKTPPSPTVNPEPAAKPIPTATASSATNLTTVQPQRPVSPQPANAPAVSGASNSANTLVGSMQSLVQTQQIASVLASTNRTQALATALTNQLVAALAATNQAGLTGTNRIQALLEQAKVLTANQKYQEALQTVTELYNNKLTPEQKQKADELSVQIQTALTQKAASGASSALGNLLGGKKQ